MHRSSVKGFTLVELIVVIVLTGILLTVAMRAGVNITQTSRVEETKQELDALAWAISGNPDLQTNGIRSDFGYVGDIGSLPPDLAALVANPGGYATWRGPYIANRFTQTPDDYRRDAWGALYSYSGMSITSTGSGESIVRHLDNSLADLTANRVTGLVHDRDGTPPGPAASPLIDVSLFSPDGTGGVVTKLTHPDPGGFFSFDSVPAGNRSLLVTYVPASDSLKKLVTVLPHSTPYVECQLSSNYWTDDTTLVLIPGSDSVSGSPPCTDISFWLANNTGTAKTIASIKVSWVSPAAYYKTIMWNSTVVFSLGGSPRGVNGATYALSSPQTILDGQKVKIAVTEFRENNSAGGGNPVQMSNGAITIRLSDGTNFTEVLPICE